MAASTLGPTRADRRKAPTCLLSVPRKGQPKASGRRPATSTELTAHPPVMKVAYSPAM